MKLLVEEINELKKQEVAGKIQDRYDEFASFQSEKSSQDWFSELCFCLLTSNSKASTAIQIQKALGYSGFTKLNVEQLAKQIRGHKHRFHNTKAKYIVKAREEHIDIKKKINQQASELSQRQIRNWISNSVLGIGTKEASHFMRNVGFTNCAVLDRHILRTMKKHKLINKIPNSLSQKNYELMEKKLDKLAIALDMDHSYLDLYLWYRKTGQVLK